MGTRLAMIDRHYGHLARDGRQHAIKLLDNDRGAEALAVHPVHAPWTPNQPFASMPTTETPAQQQKAKADPD
jgi:hypothetical protein